MVRSVVQSQAAYFGLFGNPGVRHLDRYNRRPLKRREGDRG
jgi:hypothetical protein